MKNIIYYLILLVFIALLAGYLIMGNPASMAMQQMIWISAGLILYVIAMSLVGEGKTIDERASFHRYIANRAALIAGTVVLSVGILFQLFTHHLDYWLLAGLIIINLTKIISLIFLEQKK